MATFIMDNSKGTNGTSCKCPTGLKDNLFAHCKQRWSNPTVSYSSSGVPQNTMNFLGGCHQIISSGLSNGCIGFSRALTSYAHKFTSTWKEFPSLLFSDVEGNEVLMGITVYNYLNGVILFHS